MSQKCFNVCDLGGLRTGVQRSPTVHPQQKNWHNILRITSHSQFWLCMKNEGLFVCLFTILFLNDLYTCISSIRVTLGPMRTALHWPLAHRANRTWSI